MASQMHSLPTTPKIESVGPDSPARVADGLSIAPAHALSWGIGPLLKSLRSAENDFLVAIMLAVGVLMTPVIYFGEVSEDAWRSYETPPQMDRPAARSVHILIATQTAKEEEVAKVEPPKPPPKPVVAPLEEPKAPVEVTKAPEPKPAAKPAPKPKAKARPARKAKVRRTKVKRRPASKTPDGRVQRILSKGDTPAPDGPSPSNLAEAGTGAAADGPSTPPVAGDPKGKADGIGSEPQTAPTPPAPQIDLNKLRRTYVRRVGKAVRKDFKYPRAASRVGMEGKVIVAITIDAEGNIIAAKVTKSSGFDILDNAAVAAAKSVHRVPKPPAELHWERRRVKVPFTFRLRPS